MSNYNKATNFSVKDTLTSGDPDKVVSGAEIDNEFDAISSSVGSKADKVTAATTDNLAALDANGNLKDSSESVSSIITQAAVPSGSVTMFAATSAPSGWLECDGSNVSRSTYSDLFDAIGTTFGAGDGTSTFGLPDLRGEFVRGWDNGRGADSSRSLGSDQTDTGRNVVGSIAVSEGDKGQNFVTDPQGAFYDTGASGPFEGGAEQGGSTNNRTDVYELNASRSWGNDHTSDEFRPRNIALMYIIKT